MRRRRELTTSDRWDIGLLVGLFVIVLMGAAFFWKSGVGNYFFAFATNSGARTPAAASPLEQSSNGLQRTQLLQVDEPRVTDTAPPASGPPAVSLPAPPAKPAAPAKPAIVYKWFNGEKYRYQRTMRMRVTAYAPDARCCYPYPGTTTASGESVKTNHGKLVAADTRLLPFGSLVSVPGYHGGEAVPVLDRGGAIKGRRLDVLLPKFAQAQDWGVRMVDVKVYVPVDR